MNEKNNYESNDEEVEGAGDEQQAGAQAAESAPAPAAGRMSLEPEELSLNVSQSGALTATIRPGGNDNADTAILWISSDSGIARVTDVGARRAVVTGVTRGEATVRAILEGKGDAATAQVRVT